MISIGLHWRDGLLLASEVLNDDGQKKGVRPLGGGVEFRETWSQALKREFWEELGIEISIASNPIVLEDIYVHEGQFGHEIVFAADVEFPDGAFEGQSQIEFSEDNGVVSTARWFNVDELDDGYLELYPAGLKVMLKARGM
ncbi:NUDIX domain-containing protein [uncultured Ruegeria sp.]|uniref:NUDIX hydrolase n=1 Tax=uncultured Ruegeria sp. TaxID=259304 RepID=UPI00263028B9|nr:NUDIX domain-containing protein [uncultured Ruegeria sp.]